MAWNQRLVLERTGWLGKMSVEEDCCLVGQTPKLGLLPEPKIRNPEGDSRMFAWERKWRLAEHQRAKS